MARGSFWHNTTSRDALGRPRYNWLGYNTGHDTACHAPNPGPTRSADPNRFSGRETQDWDSLPDFFFF